MKGQVAPRGCLARQGCGETWFPHAVSNRQRGRFGLTRLQGQGKPGVPHNLSTGYVHISNHGVHNDHNRVHTDVLT